MSSLSSYERMPRVDKWLSREGGMGFLSWEAASLLDCRLRVRRRANAAFSTGSLLAVAAVAVAAKNAHNRLGAGAVDSSAVRWWLLAAVLVALASVTRVWLVSRSERALAAKLPRRATTDFLMTIGRRLGVLRSVAVLLVLVVDAWVLIALPAIGASTGTVLGYGCALLVAVTCSGLMARRLLNSPTIAIDASSLAVDARLRSNDLMASVLPLLFLAIVVSLPIDVADGTPVADSLGNAIALLLPAFWLLEALGKPSLKRPPDLRAIKWLRRTG